MATVTVKNVFRQPTLAALRDYILFREEETLDELNLFGAKVIEDETTETEIVDALFPPALVSTYQVYSREDDHDDNGCLCITNWTPEDLCARRSSTLMARVQFVDKCMDCNTHVSHIIGTQSKFMCGTCIADRAELTTNRFIRDALTCNMKRGSESEVCVSCSREKTFGFRVILCDEHVKP